MDPSVQNPGSDRLAHLLNALIILGLFIYALATYNTLPEKIPIHFNTHGTPDSWEDAL